MSTLMNLENLLIHSIISPDRFYTHTLIRAKPMQ
jgi:hypothetical protein